MKLPVALDGKVLVLREVQGDKRLWCCPQDGHERLFAEHCINEGHALQLLKIHDCACDRRGYARVNAELVEAVLQAALVGPICKLAGRFLELLEGHKVREQVVLLSLLKILNYGRLAEIFARGGLAWCAQEGGLTAFGEPKVIIGMICLCWYTLVGWRYLIVDFLQWAFNNSLHSHFLLYLSLLVLFLHSVYGNLVVLLLDDLIEVLEFGVKVACSRISIYVWFLDERK